jgi:glycolate oxidase iron-sulfur subunit
VNNPTVDEGATDVVESACVHCGLCLDACPTYRLSGLEAESPRGRLYLMRGADAEDALDRQAAQHLDSCLGCLACESACPSGVRYGRRIEAFRPRVAAAHGRLRRLLTDAVVWAARNRTVLRFAEAAAAALDAVGLERFRRRLPGLGIMPRREVLADFDAGPGFTTPPQLRVAILHGCGTTELRAQLAKATVETLRHNGYEVVELEAGHCCGALDFHAGDLEGARALARRTALSLIDSRVDRVVTSAAGCGALLRQYEHLFQNDPAVHGAGRWVSANARDVCEILVEAGPRAPDAPPPTRRTVAYHDACHLLHAAGVSAAPRAVLGAAGVDVVDLGENAICCGSAGAYSLLHPDTALQLGNRKADLVAAANVDTLVVANIGCMLQLERSLALRSMRSVRVRHPVELLAEAYAREVGAAPRGRLDTDPR